MTGLEIIAVAGLASAAVGAAGAVAAGNAQAEQHKAQAQASIYNSQVKEQQARQAIDQGAARATNEAVKTRQRLAATRAGAIQNGFETDGSVNDILDVVQRDGALEGLTAMYDGGVRAQGLRQGAVLDEMSAANSRRAASTARTSGYINAGTTLLGGASKAYTGGAFG